jgi:hypothetical protein
MAWHARGQGFESPYLHDIIPDNEVFINIQVNITPLVTPRFGRNLPDAYERKSKSGISSSTNEKHHDLIEDRYDQTVRL